MIRVAIIGGGLAGAACAYVLKSCGFEPVIYEAGPQIAAGASGNALGLYNPRLSAHRTAESDYFTSAFALVLRTFSALENLDWHPCGSLHLITDEKRRKRFRKTVRNWGWPEEHMSLVSAAEASEIAGIDLNHEALWLPGSGVVSPEKLCTAYSGGVKVHLNQKIDRISELAEEAVILACGMGIKDFAETRGLPLRAVRGQITHIKPADKSRALKCNLCYGGYFTPAYEGVHMVGATFQRWLDHDRIMEKDDEENISKLSETNPGLAEGLKVSGHRAAVRATVKDHFPLVGRAAGQENLYISAGHGSHGIISSLMAAHVIAAMLRNRPMPLPRRTIARLDPARFL